ncbi:unnamed protein product [Callosobruchus maculatus]|nr:unnamed protein product [Callosobruchus maculatus]
MPRKRVIVSYKRSAKKRQALDKEDMKKAVSAVREKRMGTLKAAKTFGVPRTTVQRLAKLDHLSVDQAIQIKLGRDAQIKKER